MKQAGKRHARMIATALLVVAGLASSATADTQPTYDKRIEDAAIRMLIPKLGEMRGSLDVGASEHLLPTASQRVIENKSAEMPAPLPRGRIRGSILFF